MKKPKRKARSKPKAGIWYRPGMEKIHAFRSRVLGMTPFKDRLMVLTERGVYVSNKKMTRWRKIYPSSEVI